MVESPCVGICRLDRAGACIGCGRTSDEIQKWMTMPDEEKQKVLDRLFTDYEKNTILL